MGRGTVEMKILCNDYKKGEKKWVYGGTVEMKAKKKEKKIRKKKNFTLP